HRVSVAAERLAATDWPHEWTDLVFVSGAGTPIDAANFRRLVRDVARAAGLDDVVPYALRHIATSLLADAGVPTQYIADLLGHVDGRMVERVYRHPLAPHVTAAASPMERLLGAG